MQPLVQRGERARCLGHDRRLDGDRSSIPVTVRIHRGDARERTLLADLRPVLALGTCELALDPPPPVLGAVREVLLRLGLDALCLDFDVRPNARPACASASLSDLTKLKL